MSPQVEIFLPRFIMGNQTCWKASCQGMHCPAVTSSLTPIRVCKQTRTLTCVKPRWRVQTFGVIVKVKGAQRPVALCQHPEFGFTFQPR